MMGIHENRVRHGRREVGSINYAAGANIAGSVKVSDEMPVRGATLDAAAARR